MEREPAAGRRIGDAASHRDARPRRSGGREPWDAEERFRQLAENIREVFWVADLAGQRMLYASPGYEIVWGRPTESLLRDPTTWLAAIHPDDRPRVEDALDDCLRSGSFFEEYRIVRPDGGTRWIRDRGFPVRDAGGRAFRIAGIAEDISERKRAERALRRSEEQRGALLGLFRGLCERAGLGLLLARPDGRLVACNETFGRLLGRAPQELVDRSLSGLVREEDAVSGDLRRLVAGRPVEPREIGLVCRDGSTCRVRATMALLPSGPGSDACALAIVEDLGERRRAERERRSLEDQLRHSQKLEALGQLAGGVAHDFNNLLTAILGNTELVLGQLGQSLDAVSARAAADTLQQVQLAGERAAALTRQLLAFSRKQNSEAQVLDLNRVVADMDGLLRRLIGEHIELEVRLSSAPVLVLIDPVQIEQVLMNLVLNARDAMPRGGRLRIGCSAERLGGACGGDPATAGTGEHALIRVADDGEGMDAETRKHIFEPFFTTKPMGRGTGLGLSTVYGIVRQADGHVEVDSAPGRGAVFRVRLPLVDGTIRRGEPSAPDLSHRGSEVVLVCEDEEAVRKVTCQVLRAAGYAVLEGHGGPHALDVARRHVEGLDLLVTDVVMPAMNGRELVRRLQRRHENLRVLYVSGHPADVIDVHGVNPIGEGFLQKPFDPATLLRRVREILDARSDKPA